MRKILLYGIGSFKNKGVEALTKSTINQIGEEYDVSAAVFDYDFNSKRYKDRIKYLHHYLTDKTKMSEKELKEIEKIESEEFDHDKYELFYEREVIKELKNNDIAIHIGGDNYCYGGNHWLYSFNKKANELNKKVVLWGASLFDEIKDLELLTDLNRYDLLLIREKISYNAIKDYIDKDKLMLVPDSAFSLEPKEIKMNDWYKGRKVLGLNLSPLVIKSDDDLNSVYSFMDYILNNTDYSISLIPHVTVEDVSDLLILNQIKEKYKDNEKVYLESGELDCSEIKYVISNLDFLVCGRTHASIAAYSTCVPTLVLGYSVKSRGIAEDLFGSYKEYVLPIDELSGENLINMFNHLNDQYDSIVKTLKMKMKKIVPEASGLFNKMIERLDYLDKKKICEHKHCSGCSACANVCPVKAIKMEKNSEGFLYPKIDLEKCIHCNKCRNVCPTLNKKENKEYLNCYAAKSTDDDLRMKSSSGGLFTIFAEEYLNKDGIVYGACLNDSFKVQHIRIDNIEDLYKIRGSKYAQSELHAIFENVKKDLIEKKEVLFSGTPCQINGLKNYLGKEYSNLLTISVICHGVISNDLLEKRIDEFNRKYDCNVEKVNFRSKKNGWEAASIAYESDKINKTYKFSDDPMMCIFNNNYALRESCYNCSSKGVYNQADIILGDYWGVYNVHKDLFDQKGVSAVIVKTENGQKAFNEIVNKVVSKNTKYNMIKRYNSPIVSSVPRPDYRSKIFVDMSNNTLEMIHSYISGKLLVSKNGNVISKDINEIVDKNNDLINENNRINQELAEANQKLESIYYSRSYKIYRLLKKIIKRK